MKMMMITTVVILLLLETLYAEPRSQKIKLMCGSQLEHNTTLFVPNFVATMENISTQIRSSGFGLAEMGSGPDKYYGLAQCYGDLSPVDCVLCYSEARTILPQCYPREDLPRWLLHAGRELHLLRRVHGSERPC